MEEAIESLSKAHSINTEQFLMGLATVDVRVATLRRIIEDGIANRPIYVSDLTGSVNWSLYHAEYEVALAFMEWATRLHKEGVLAETEAGPGPVVFGGDLP